MINIKNRYLPKDTGEMLQKIPAENFNFAYLYNLPDIYEKDGKPEKIRINERIENYKWDSQFILAISKRIATSINLFKNCGFQVASFDSTISWRMVIGLGGTHPQETSMTLHHIYGIPYIPGSAVKGVTRHWVILDKFDNDEKKAEENIDFQNIFGTQSKVGEVIFFDAYPVGEINLKLDVMTPHYQDYYSGKTPPADWLSPNPIKFLTVEKTKFKFYLASKESNLLKKAEEWLKEALQKYGIGAKTSIGYGFFEF